MNTILKAIAAVLMILSAANVVSAKPKAYFPEKSHDFGAFFEDDGYAKCRFAVVNTGSSPLVIMSARATCGCTIPDYPRQAIEPGDSAYISVIYDPAGRPGRFNKSVIVETNASSSKTRLDITGVVIANEKTVSTRYPADFGALRLGKRIFSLGEAASGRMKTVYLEGYNRSADSLHIAVVRRPEYADITVAPAVAPPGEQVTLIAYVTPGKNTPYGILEDTLLLSVNSAEPIALPLSVNVKEDFSRMSPDQISKSPVAVPESENIDLGRVDRLGAPVTARLKLSNLGKSNLIVRRVYSLDPAVKAEAASSSVKKGKSTEINITVDPSQISGSMINSRLNIITNDPLHPVYTVRIVGEWSNLTNFAP